MSKFEIYQDVADDYRWRLKARNGEIVAISESYTRRANATESALKVRQWSSEADINQI